MAQKTGLASDTIRRLEYGHFSPTLHTFLKIAEGLGISAGKLLNEKFDEADEMAEYIRDLPELERGVAIVILRSLHDHAKGEV
ncbi:hypothetical protein PPSIR1_19037 [Plesiocystis pacifica SIR-1]|uniref:HTH cro/C1-type domain-containing protein n=2 Tax=Plesiocystis pacifica TaxID=191768 RepID=A6GGM4_9BACT|nr:hypothetical protein PPSIR1_19037 [Plesiocystis pacifica SIR-1]